jgi:2,4-dienoyl-CoA reductase-like NADH-dependent reductase (Old Yellow Enzyme family)
MHEHLLNPARIGNLSLNNRIATAPMCVELVEADGGAALRREEVAADTGILAAGLGADPEPARRLREAGVPRVEIGPPPSARTATRTRGRRWR